MTGSNVDDDWMIVLQSGAVIDMWVFFIGRTEITYIKKKSWNPKHLKFNTTFDCAK